MAVARTLLMLLGALGVLLLGAVPPAMADSPPPPCHEMSGMGHGDSAPQPAARALPVGRRLTPETGPPRA